MIRKAVIVVLTLGAVSNALLWCVCTVPHRPGPRDMALRGYWTSDPYLIRGCIVSASLSYRLANRRWNEAFWSSDVGIFRITCYSPHKCTSSFARHSYARYREFGGFGFNSGLTCCAKGRLGISFSADVPLWASSVFLATYPTIAFIRGPLRRWRRRKRGECVNCGYNLTGNVTGVCSECGMRIA